jgi:hypothetical protein
MRLPTLSLFLLPLASFAAACSGEPASNATSVTQTVGASGGTIVLDRATVTFPAGALAQDTPITIEETSDPAPAGYTALSHVYRCGPSGLSFAKNVTMAMQFTGDGLPTTMFWSSGSDPAFKDVGGTASGNVMSASVAHFSQGFVGHQP